MGDLKEYHVKLQIQRKKNAPSELILPNCVCT